MKFAPLLFLAAVSCAAAHATVQDDLRFSRDQLSGWWADNFDTNAACGPEGLKVRFEFSEDGKRLLKRYNRKWQSAIGETDNSGATILRSTERSIVIRYDEETRLKRSGLPMEWELWVVAPGVYRWRETDWPSHQVNGVVGIRCGQ